MVNSEVTPIGDPESRNWIDGVARPPQAQEDRPRREGFPAKAHSGQTRGQTSDAEIRYPRDYPGQR